MKSFQGVRFPLFVAVPLILTLSLLFSALLFWVQGRLSGGPLLLLLLAGTLLFFLIAMGCGGFWVYQDCKLRGEEPVLWVLLCALSYFLILPVYLFRRPKQRALCPECRHPLAKGDRFCTVCGASAQNPVAPPKHHHSAYFLTAILSFILSILCLAGFVYTFFSFAGDLIDQGRQDVTILSQESLIGGVWTVSFHRTSDGYTFRQDLTLPADGAPVLQVDAACGTVPEGASLELRLLQGETAVTLDLTDLSQPLVYPLDSFQSGVLSLELQSNGVEDVSVVVALQS